MRSATLATSRSLWVMKMMDRPPSASWRTMSISSAISGA